MHPSILFIWLILSGCNFTNDFKYLRLIIHVSDVLVDLYKDHRSERVST